MWIRRFLRFFTIIICTTTLLISRAILLSALQLLDSITTHLNSLLRVPYSLAQVFVERNVFEGKLRKPALPLASTTIRYYYWLLPTN